MDEWQGEFDFGEQGENLERVSSRIGKAIVQFCKEHRRFHADELRRHVIRETGIAAPASADRVLRHLRQHKQLDYRVVSRRESLYQIQWVKGDGEAAA
jgi:hypothetical protein